MKKEKIVFKEIIVPNDGRTKWIGGAYCLAFVYSKSGNFLVKGFHKEVEDYIQTNFKYYFCCFSLWSKEDYTGKKRHRDIWKFWKPNVYVFDPDPFSKVVAPTTKWRFVRYPQKDRYQNSIGKPKKELSFRRLPNRWIPELNQF